MNSVVQNDICTALYLAVLLCLHCLRTIRGHRWAVSKVPCSETKGNRVLSNGFCVAIVNGASTFAWSASLWNACSSQKAFVHWNFAVWSQRFISRAWPISQQPRQKQNRWATTQNIVTVLKFIFFQTQKMCDYTCVRCVHSIPSRLPSSKLISIPQAHGLFRLCVS